MKAYFVSTFGDISIEQIEKNVIVKTSALTILEEEIFREIIRNYKSGITKVSYEKYIKADSLENLKITLIDTDINKVHKFMRSKLKKNKAVLTALKFRDGRIELSEEIKDDADKSVTVDKPKIGCPMPVMLNSEVRASAVLKEFLTKEQNVDYDKFKQIISIGGWTTHPYIITSRWSPKVETNGQLYDLVDKRIVCANCRDIPPSEEILSLKLSVELNEREFLGANLF